MKRHKCMCNDEIDNNCPVHRKKMNRNYWKQEDDYDWLLITEDDLA